MTSVFSKRRGASLSHLNAFSPVNMLFLLCSAALAVPCLKCSSTSLLLAPWIFPGHGRAERGVLCMIGNIFTCLNCPLDFLLLEDCDYVFSPIVFIALTQLTGLVLMLNKYLMNEWIKDFHRILKILDDVPWL